MVFVRGQVSQDLDTRASLHVGDAGKQTEKTMPNIKLLMEEAGGKMDHICRIVVYFTDIRYREAVYREMGKWLKGVFPVRPASSSGAGATGMGGRNRGDSGHPGLMRRASSGSSSLARLCSVYRSQSANRGLMPLSPHAMRS